MKREELTDKVGQLVVFKDGYVNHWHAWIGELKRLKDYRATVQVAGHTRFIHYSDILFVGGDNACRCFQGDMNAMYKQIEDKASALVSERAERELEIIKYYNMP